MDDLRVDNYILTLNTGILFVGFLHSSKTVCFGFSSTGPEGHSELLIWREVRHPSVCPGSPLEAWYKLDIEVATFLLSRSAIRCQFMAPCELSLDPFRTLKGVMLWRKAGDKFLSGF